MRNCALLSNPKTIGRLPAGIRAQGSSVSAAETSSHHASSATAAAEPSRGISCISRVSSGSRSCWQHLAERDPTTILMIRRRVDGVQRDNLAINLSADVASMAWESPRRFSVCGAFASTKLGPARPSTPHTRAERRRDGRRRRPRLFTRGATRHAAGCRRLYHVMCEFSCSQTSPDTP